jgi:hypothetical protein
VSLEALGVLSCSEFSDLPPLEGGDLVSSAAAGVAELELTFSPKLRKYKNC